MTTRLLVAIAGLAAAATSSHAQQLVMVADSTNDRISTFSAVDGSLVNASFIVNQPGFTFNFPKDVIQVGNEVWVSDQTADSIFGFNIQASNSANSVVSPVAAWGAMSMTGASTNESSMVTANKIAITTAPYRIARPQARKPRRTQKPGDGDTGSLLSAAP